MFFRMVYKSGQIFLPFVHIARVWQTNRRTDRRTDRILIARPRLHCMQHGNKMENREPASDSFSSLVSSRKHIYWWLICCVYKPEKIL